MQYIQVVTPPYFGDSSERDQLKQPWYMTLFLTLLVYCFNNTTHLLTVDVQEIWAARALPTKLNLHKHKHWCLWWSPCWHVETSQVPVSFLCSQNGPHFGSTVRPLLIKQKRVCGCVYDEQEIASSLWDLWVLTEPGEQIYYPTVNTSCGCASMCNGNQLYMCLSLTSI